MATEKKEKVIAFTIGDNQVMEFLDPKDSKKVLFRVTQDPVGASVLLIEPVGAEPILRPVEGSHHPSVAFIPE